MKTEDKILIWLCGLLVFLGTTMGWLIGYLIQMMAPK